MAAEPRRRIDLEWLKMLVTPTLALVYVLVVAAKPLPIAATPSCPHCGQPMTYLGFVPAPAGSVMIHDSS